MWTCSSFTKQHLNVSFITHVTDQIPSLLHSNHHDLSIQNILLKPIIKIYQPRNDNPPPPPQKKKKKKYLEIRNDPKK